MTDRELWNVIWRALRMVEIAIAKKYGFGEYRESVVLLDERAEKSAQIEKPAVETADMP